MLFLRENAILLCAATRLEENELIKRLQNKKKSHLDDTRYPATKAFLC